MNNAQQDEIRVRAWKQVRDLLERQLAPLGQRALAALAPKPGEQALDIGCGGAETTLDLARSVGPNGSVVGIDISSAVCAVARETVANCHQVQLIQADAQAYPFERAAFDIAFSRFGMMFFTDPIAAFANIHCSLKHDGRLAFICWRALEENQLDMLPLAAASEFLPPQVALDPSKPGPFSFADPNRLRGILTAAGFTEIRIEAHDQKVGSGNVDAMLAVCSQVGALGKILREHPELRHSALPAVRAALAACAGPDGVKLNAATWIVTART